MRVIGRLVERPPRFGEVLGKRLYRRLLVGEGYRKDQVVARDRRRVAQATEHVALRIDLKLLDAGRATEVLLETRFHARLPDL